ncbi:MAG: hypothetical protein CM15mP120_06530 [Pseudomonadota bacterium]|nr:MAG: hypothetical protein CM15mP120_06530 [Pseudomonadota bacterium]
MCCAQEQHAIADQAGQLLDNVAGRGGPYL